MSAEPEYLDDVDFPAYTTGRAAALLRVTPAFLRNLGRGEAYAQEAPTLWDVDFKTAVAQAELEDRERPGAYHRISFSGRQGQVYEADDIVGGIARTQEVRGYRFDLGGHRFFTKLRPMNCRWIWLVPSQIWVIFASRIRRSTR